MKLNNKIELYVTELLKNVLKFEYTYHNLAHTKNVVEAVNELAKKENLTENEIQTLTIAAWFHDTGYVICVDGHENESVKIAEKFLIENNFDTSEIKKITELILATVFNHKPKNLSEKIICDADYAHIASENYFKIVDNLKREWKLSKVADYSEKEWLKENLNFLKNKHQFFTDYAKEYWQIVKNKNIKEIELKIKKMEDLNQNNNQLDVKKKKKKKKKRKNPKLGRGVETLFRVTINNHTRLSDIADSKANILLSVNAVIISVALSVLIPKLDSPGNNYLSLPTFVLLFFSVISIVFAILATRPKVTTSDFTKDDIINKKVNLLFFGNFYKVDYQDYQDEINKMMLDNDYLYNSLTKDLHYLGIILDRKYKLLRITYNIFMVGIIISVFAFLYAYRNS